MNKARAFMLRDFRLNASYRLSFLMSFGGIFVTVSMFFFMSQLFGSAISPHLAEYDGDYFAFVLIGVAFSGLVSTGLKSFSQSISRAQAQGTLEAILVTHTSVSSIVLLSSLWSFLFNAFNVFIYIAVGRLVFGLSLSNANPLAALVVLLLATATFSGIGVISAAFIVVFKRGNPIDWLYGLSASLLGGMYFPPTVLPSWLQPVSYVIPLYHALRAMRLAVLKGYSLTALSGEIGALAGFAVVILPFSLWAFKRAVREAKKDGSLVTY